MGKIRRVARATWAWAEKIHTVVWLLEITGLTALSLTLFKRYSSRPLDWVSVTVGFVASLFVLILGNGTYLYVLRQKGTGPWGPIVGPVRQLHKKFDVKVTTPDGQPPYFKRKIRVILKNVSTEYLEAEAPDWITEAGDLAIQPGDKGGGAASKLRIEDCDNGGWAADKWQEERTNVPVPPGRAFEVWVGLSHNYTDRELELHSRQNKIGVLALPIFCCGRKTIHRIRVI